MRLGPKFSNSWQQYRRLVPIVLAGIIGLSVSISAWRAVSLREFGLAELEFSSRAKGHALILQNGINEYVSRIAAVRALFEASDRVDREEFALFTDRMLSERKAILRVTWLPRVRRGDRQAHEIEAARQGIASYRIHDYGNASTPSPERNEYFPVFYSTDAGKSSRVYGLDVYSEPMRRATLERARDTGEVTTSPSIALDAASGDHHGFFILLPVYRRGAPSDTVEERREALIGFVNAVFQTGVMVETILAGTATPGGLDLHFFPGEAGLDSPPLYFHASRARASPSKPQPRTTLLAGPHWSTPIPVGDRQWVFVASPIASGQFLSGVGRAHGVLFGGILITSLVVWHMIASALHARRLETANSRLDCARAELETQNSRFDAALNNMSEGLCMFDGEQRLLVSNARYARMYGLRPEQLTPGLTVREVCEARVRYGVYASEIPEEYANKLLAVVAENTPTTRIQELSDGRVIALKYQPMLDGGWVATHEDVTEQRRIQERMAYMAHHDALTDLANRVRLRQCLEEALSDARERRRVAVLCLDLDRFKEVNDSLGHPIGDALLKSVATRLRGCVRESDTVARLGGDEFAIVQTAANQPTDATVLATRVIEVISAAHDIDGQQIVIGTSIGIAVSPGDGATGDDLLKSADLALYRAKSEGRGAHRFFEREMDERMRARRNLERDLRQALANNEFELHYQPLVDVKRNEVMAFEALLRWNHPERGRVSPADFIPMAEETGLIIPIGEWVLRQACADAAGWPTEIRVAVNLSSVQFRSSNLVGSVSDALNEFMVGADRLELEITETVLLHDSARTLSMLHELRALGVRISMDDFGTGYSSLSYLQSFPFDKIKIDQSFIRNINQNSQSRAIVHAVAGLGLSLGVSTTAEGVETQEQFELVCAEGLTEVQGFYFSKPIPVEEIPAFLSTLSPAQAA